MTILNKINKAIETKAKKFGLMGTENVNIVIELTDEELKEFNNTQLNDHYQWEINGKYLEVVYTEEN